MLLNFPWAEKWAFTNAIVHTIMYYHFTFRLPKWTRPMITLLQIIQFVLGFVMHTYAITLECAVPLYTNRYLEFLTPFVIVGVYLIYFIRFFVHTYFYNTPSTTTKIKM